MKSLPIFDKHVNHIWSRRSRNRSSLRLRLYQNDVAPCSQQFCIFKILYLKLYVLFAK
jgi:hypothetical protein